MTEYGLNLYWKSLLARIATLERYGIQFCLSEDAEELTIRAPKRLTVHEFFRGAINDKPLFLEAVRLREGLCVACGLDAVKRPKREGVWHNWIPETQTVETAKCSALGVYPFYCDTCWTTRLMWRGIVEKKNACREETTEESPDTDSPQTLRRKRVAVADAGRDSGGDGVGVLSFAAD